MSQKEKAPLPEVVMYEHVGFVRSAWKGKTLKEFQEHEKHHGLSKDQLAEAWELIQGKTKPEAAAEGPQETK